MDEIVAPAISSWLKPTRWYALPPAWFEMQPARLLLERRAMADKFPHFQLFLTGRILNWRGTLETNRNNRYVIDVVYPPEFPGKAPLVFPHDPVIQVNDVQNPGRYKHQYPDGHLCLYYPGDKTFQPNTTAATVVAVAAAWFFSYESWVESGYREWPGQEAPEDFNEQNFRR